MSIDKLQDRIRKLKSPVAVDMFAQAEHIPQKYLSESECFLRAYLTYCKELLEAMKDTAAAIRMDHGMFSLYGQKGLEVLRELSHQAHRLGYYVLLQIPEPLSRRGAVCEAQLLFAQDASVWFDGLLLAADIGSDAIAPFVEYLKAFDKDLFVVARTSNRSAAEMQDLRSGSRLAYMAKADIANRYADGLVGKSGYSKIALVGAASSVDCLYNLREKYTSIFLLLDGCDYPNANAKNCSAAFDKLGHGALACAGLSVLAAWRECENEADPVVAAQKAVERHKKNLLRYVSVL